MPLKDQFVSTLPIWPVIEGKCTCGDPACNPKRKYKHPARNAPGPGYAVETGQANNLFVLDIDVKGATNGYKELEALGEVPHTLTVSTPSGGAHIYFKHPGFHVRNRKPSPAIDIKGDRVSADGYVYVVGPGSPGETLDGEPASYEIVDDSPIAEAPDWLIAWLQIADTRKASFAPTPIDPSHVDWNYRLRLGEEAAKEYKPSKGDGEGGKRLFAICIRLVRALELPLDTAFALIEEHFNPRCTNTSGTHWPWSDSEIVHKLEDARDRSDIECGIFSEETTKGFAAMTRFADPPYKREQKAQEQGQGRIIEGELLDDEAPAAAPKPAGRKKPDPNHRYSIRIGNLACAANADTPDFNAVVAKFTSGVGWEGCWQYDQFADRIICVDPPLKLDAETTGLSEDDASALRSYLECHGMLVREPDILKAVRQAAKSNGFHPVKEYLNALPKGDPSIFEGLAKRLFGTDEPLADEFLKKFMVASVRRSLQPGTQVDTVLVLYGPNEGEGKTTCVEALFEEKWTRRGLPADLANRDASHALLGYRCVELGELSSLLRTEKNAAKDFITWREDVYRQYGNADRIRRARECVFFGTTNDDDFLRDAGTNRRFWVIEIPDGHSVPTPWIREHRDILWAAALELARDATFRHWFTREEEVREVKGTREAYQARDAWHEAIEGYCRGRKMVKAADIFTKALGGDLKDFDRTRLLRISDSLKRLGCQSSVRNKQKYWIVPNDLANEPPSKVIPGIKENLS